MAKIKKYENTDSGGEMAVVRRWFDMYWQNEHGRAMPDWIVNTAQTVNELRAMACFCQPQMVDVIGKEFHFLPTSTGDMAKRQWQNTLYDIICKYGFIIYEKPKQLNEYWDDMTEAKQLGFAKAIWVKRDKDGPYPHYLQAILCRIKKSPDPQTLKTWLEHNGVDVNNLEFKR